jgi:hypothetical protein
MIKAMMAKELRETLGIGAIALAFYLALVSNLMGMGLFNWVPTMPGWTQEVPFTGSEFLSFYTVVSALLAIALGFRQAFGEDAKGTYQFLLHRPAHRNSLFLTKLGTGVLLLLLCTAIPILLYGGWAARPGHLPGPFAWSMTLPAWQMWFAMPVLYLGAFLSGLWPARWLGTRLLPLLAAGLLVAVVFFVPWWLLGLGIAAASSVLLVTNIAFVAGIRDYS